MSERELKKQFNQHLARAMFGFSSLWNDELGLKGKHRVRGAMRYLLDGETELYWDQRLPAGILDSLRDKTSEQVAAVNHALKERDGCFYSGSFFPIDIARNLYVSMCQLRDCITNTCQPELAAMQKAHEEHEDAFDFH